MIDAHCHLQFPEFDSLNPFPPYHSHDLQTNHHESLHEHHCLNLQGFIVADYDSKHRQKLLSLEQRSDTWITAGIHPWALSKSHQKNEKEWLLLEQFVDKHHHQIVAIGECGLDAMIKHGAPIDTQWEFLKRHLDLAKQYDLPIVLHLVGLHDAFIEYLHQHNLSHFRFLYHAFSGTPEQAKSLLTNGSFLSIGTDILRGNGRTREVCKQIGIDKLMIETDSPSRCPKPLIPPTRPAYLIYVAEKIAQILKLDLNVVAEKTETHTRNFFQI